MPQVSTGVQVRWMIRRDMPEVLRIEQKSFDFPWNEDEFVSCLKQNNCIGMVAERDEVIVGFMIYEFHQKVLRIVNLAVGPWARHQNVGRQMIAKLVNKLSQQRRETIVAEVRESNLDAQLFFSQMGFWALDTLRNYYEDTDEDAYRFEYTLEESC